MNHNAYWYAFLSSTFSKTLDENIVADFLNSLDLLEMLDSVEFFQDTKKATDLLNIDYTTTLIVNSPPIESYIKTIKDSAPTGLDNEAVMFYNKHGFNFALNKSELNAPDHLAIELGFMQALCLQENSEEVQKQFLKERLLPWAIPYLIGIKSSFETPFYRNICDMSVEFLLSHYEELNK